EWANGTLPADTQFVVKKLNDKSDEAKLVKALSKDELTNLFGYDVSIKDAEVKINGKVKVSIPLPKDTDLDNLVIYDVEGEGILEITNYEIIDNMLLFETDELGKYVLGTVVEDTT